jgi:hypothetical protein
VRLVTFSSASAARLKGVVLFESGNATEGERWLRQALELATNQGARIEQVSAASELIDRLSSKSAHEFRDPLMRAVSEVERGADLPAVTRARAKLQSLGAAIDEGAASR